MTSGCAGAKNLAEPLRIGDVVVDPPLVLGPMAGTTNRVYRLLCRRGGAGLVSAEMVSINALAQGNERSLRMLEVWEQERPVSMQLFGSDPKMMREAVGKAIEAGADIVDINMGCSVPKVRRNGAGVALMSEPDRAAALTAAAVESSSVPVTVKIRSGMTVDDRSYVETARRLQDAGAAAITVHWRAASQKFSGEANWESIARVVEALDVPVIGNGDVVDPQDAPRMVRETGCDAVMIARGAWGRPWFFGQAAAALRGEPVPPDPDIAGRLGVALLHAQMLVTVIGERMAMHQMRAQLHQYVRGLPCARVFRQDANRITTLAQLRELIERYVATIRTARDDEPIDRQVHAGMA